MWFFLENVLCALEKNVYSAALTWNVCIGLLGPLVYTVVQVLWFLFDLLSVLISIIESVVLKFPTIIVLLCIFSLHFCQSVLCIFRCSVAGGRYICIWYVFLINWNFYHYIMPFFVSCDSFWVSLFGLMWLPFLWNIFFYSFAFSLFVLKSKVSLL